MQCYITLAIPPLSTKYLYHALHVLANYNTNFS